MEYSKTDEKIFDFVYGAAMRDATNQQAYPFPKKWLTDCDQFPKSRDAIQKLVSDVIEGIFSKDEDSVRSYDDRFRDACITVCDEINQHSKHPKNEGKFCFGHAQKLINMVMKFFYLHSYGSEEETQNFSVCHCPMDGQMLNKVWSRRTELSEETRKAIGKEEEFLKSWGKEDDSKGTGKRGFPKRYEAFQDAVRELAKDISPLEFDFFEWGK